MPSLNDTQLTILTWAAQREDLAVVTLERRAASREAVASLLKSKLLGTVPKTSNHALWERDKSGRPLGLVITPKGLKAINADEAGPAGHRHIRTRGSKYETDGAVWNSTMSIKRTLNWTCRGNEALLRASPGLPDRSAA
jgi:hypothetical protein